MTLPELRTPFILAPIAGVTDAVFRRLCAQMGAAFAYTEMVSAKALCFSDKRTFELLRTLEGEGPLGVQLFGSEPETIAKAITLLPDKFSVIDINMGCPARKITSNGEGSALMKTPQLAARIVSAAVKAASVPVTVKMRLGYSQNTALEFARAVQDAGAAMIAVHGRTTLQQYAGEADWDAIANVRQALSVPVIANGDAMCAQSALALLKHTRCEAVMIARGALGNPWIFSAANALISGGMPGEPSLSQRIEVAVRHVLLAADYYGEGRAALIMRKHCAWYIRGVKNSARARVRLNACTTSAGLVNVLESLAIDGHNI